MMDVVNYLKERTRMTDSCNINCHDCPFSRYNNGTGEGCTDFEGQYPEEAVRIVEEWSNAHPIQTNGQKFVEVFGFEPTTWNKMGEEIHDFIADPQWWHEQYESPKGD